MADTPSPEDVHDAPAIFQCWLDGVSLVEIAAISGYGLQKVKRLRELGRQIRDFNQRQKILQEKLRNGRSPNCSRKVRRREGR